MWSNKFSSAEIRKKPNTCKNTAATNWFRFSQAEMMTNFIQTDHLSLKK